MKIDKKEMQSKVTNIANKVKMYQDRFEVIRNFAEDWKKRQEDKARKGEKDANTSA